MRMLRALLGATVLLVLNSVAQAQPCIFCSVQLGINRGATPSPICILSGPTCLSQIGTISLTTGQFVASHPDMVDATSYMTAAQIADGKSFACALDNTVPINTALATARHVWLPRGCWRTTSRLIEATDGTILEGEGWAELYTNSLTAGTVIFQDYLAAADPEGIYITGQHVQNRNFEIRQRQPAPGVGWTPNVTPWAIHAHSQVFLNQGTRPVIENIMLRNVYNGIYLDRTNGGELKGIWGQAFNIGILANFQTDEGSISEVHLGWPYWSSQADVFAYQLAHTEALKFGRLDNWRLNNAFAFHVNKGVHTFTETDAGAGGANAGTVSLLQSNNVGCDDCVTGWYLEDSPSLLMNNVYVSNNSATVGSTAILNTGVLATSGFQPPRLEINNSHFVGSYGSALKFNLSGLTIPTVVDLSNSRIQGFDYGDASQTAIDAAANVTVNTTNLIVEGKGNKDSGVQVTAAATIFGGGGTWKPACSPGGSAGASNIQFWNPNTNCLDGFTMNGDATLTPGNGVITVAKVNSVAYPASPSTNTVPVVTGTNQITYEAVPNAALANAFTTVNTVTCTLGASCTVTATPSGAAGGDLSGTYPNPTLATVNANVGSFGSSTAIPNFTVDAKGRITAAGTNVVIAPAGTLTGAALASGVTGSSLTSFGASPVLTGTPTAPTAAVDTSTTQIATTAFTVGQAASATPLIDGTAAAGTSTRYARADHVHPTDTSRAALASPTFTGTPAGPTAAVDTNTTQLATTAFVLGQAASATPLIDGTAAAGTSTRYARADHVHPTDTSRAASNASTTVNGVACTLGSTCTVTAAAGTLTGATLTSGVTASSLTSLGNLTALQLNSFSVDGDWTSYSPVFSCGTGVVTTNGPTPTGAYKRIGKTVAFFINAFIPAGYTGTCQFPTMTLPFTSNASYVGQVGARNNTTGMAYTANLDGSQTTITLNKYDGTGAIGATDNFKATGVYWVQ